MKNIFIWMLLYYLRFFARLSLSINKPKIIGITGSVGKSSARNAIYAALKDYFKVKMIKEGNSETGVPLGILGIDPGHYQMTDWLRVIFLSPFKINYLKGIEYLIVEMGIDSPYPPKNMDYLLTIVKPDISVVLNVHPVHTEQFDRVINENLIGKKRLKSILDRIAEEKLKIITEVNPKIGIINENLASPDLRGREGTKLMIFGNNKDVDIRFLDYQADLKETTFKYLLTKDNQEIIVNIKNFVLPKGYEEIFAATILVGKALNLSNIQIKTGLEKSFSMPLGRGSLFSGIRDSVIIDSSYNASKTPVLTYLELSHRLAEQETRPLVFLFGDMRELGEEARQEHLQIVQEIIKKVSQLYCVGPLTKQFVIPQVTGKIKEAKWFENSVQAGIYLEKHLPYRSIILVKGSQNQIFLEEAIKKILKSKSDFKNLCRQSDFWMWKKQS